MSSQYGPLNITPGVTVETQISGYPDTGAVVVYNESPYYVTVTPVGSGGQFPLPAYTADIIPIDAGFNGTIHFYGLGYLSTTSNGPSSVIFLKTVSTSESLYLTLINGGGTGYPIPLQRLFSIGNDVTVGSSSLVANSLVNTNNAGVTPVIDVRPSSLVADTFFLDNFGDLVIKTWDGILLRQLLNIQAPTTVQIGIAGSNTEIMGGLQVDGGEIVGGNLTVSGSASLQGAIVNSTLEVVGTLQPDSQIIAKPGNNLVLNGSTGNAVTLAVNGTALLVARAANTSVTNTLVLSQGSTLNGIGFFNGVGPGTFAHGSPTSPFRVFFVTNNGTANAISYDGLGAANVNVHVGAGVAWFGMYINI